MVEPARRRRGRDLAKKCLTLTFEAEEADGWAETAATIDQLDREKERAADLKDLLLDEKTTRTEALKLYENREHNGWTDEHMANCLRRWPRSA